MNIAKIADAINECFINCFRVAEQMASSGHWLGDKPVGLDVIDNHWKFLSHLMAADNYLRAEEADLYRLIHNRPDEIYDDIKDELLYYVDKSPNFFSEVPEFLDFAMDYDIDHNTSHTATIIRNLERIGIHVISCDDDMSPEEIELLSSYINFLREVASARGIEVVLLSDELSEDEGSRESGEVLEISKAAEPDLDTLMVSLNRLVGLNKVKLDVTSLTNLIKVRELRRRQSMPLPPISMHLVFTGNPGTGKTTVARLLAQIYREMGMLSTGQLIETDRSGLVAGYLGQTALKVQSVVKQAIGGVLFIDEAYSLINPGYHSDQYGEEAIGALLKLMEDNRDNLIVIVAGYPDKMEDFLKSNPGLRSRFNKFIHFDDYSPNELHTIFARMCQDNGYALSQKADDLAHLQFEAAFTKGSIADGNGRAVRNFFESTISNHANRLATRTSLSVEDLSTIRAQDLPNLQV